MVFDRKFPGISIDICFVGILKCVLLHEIKIPAEATCLYFQHGLLITNANDYVIFEKGWKGSRRKRSAKTERKLGMRVANITELGTDM